MDFLDPALQKYIELHTASPSPILNQLDRETHTKVLMPRMISGHLQGRVLAMLSHMIKPKRILEIGTYTGYSAISLCEGLEESGKLITIDIDEELEGMVNRYIAEAGLEDQVDNIIGDATKIIPELKDTFDIVFIDADKGNYSNYFDLVIDKVRTGGYIIADNVLWSGKVVDQYEEVDKDTKAIIDFNTKVHHDTRVENVLFPIRDGLMILRKL